MAGVIRRETKMVALFLDGQAMMDIGFKRAKVEEITTMNEKERDLMRHLAE